MASPKLPTRLLTFTQYKALGKQGRVGYNPAFDKLPCHPWYSLPQDRLKAAIRQVLLPLSTLAKTRSMSDIEISKLLQEIEDADTVSLKKSFCVAILGEQGIGKSQTLCSILDRPVVHVSSSSLACTAFPTIIAYKEGAEDETKKSDIYIQYLNHIEIADCVQEQARRYREGHPLKYPDQSTSRNRQREYWTPEPDDSDYEDDEDYNEEEKLTEEEKKQVMSSARTAKEFFQILFHADQLQERQNELDQALGFGNLQNDEFTRKCLRYAQERLTCIGASNGRSEHRAVHDDDLASVRSGASRLWPLVKSVRLETGHILLRNNLSFLDLPGKTHDRPIWAWLTLGIGYGDYNQMRTALIEEYREMANFKIVVAPAQRLSTSTTHTDYLKRSMRRLESRNTLLVANKSDVDTTK